MADGINPTHLRERVIRPTLQAIELYSTAAEALLLGTAAHESRLGRYLVQVNGPARGIYQMEPATHDDLWRNYLPGAGDAYDLMRRWGYDAAPYPSPDQLVYDLRYATAMTRLHYRRIAAPLPAADDLPGLAAYWKRYYNTPQGKGTEAQWLQDWNTLVGG